MPACRCCLFDCSLRKNAVAIHLMKQWSLGAFLSWLTCCRAITGIYWIWIVIGLINSRRNSIKMVRQWFSYTLWDFKKFETREQNWHGKVPQVEETNLIASYNTKKKITFLSVKTRFCQDSLSVSALCDEDLFFCSIGF